MRLGSVGPEQASGRDELDDEGDSSSKWIIFWQEGGIGKGSVTARRLGEARAGVASVAFGNVNLFPGGLTKVSHPPAASATVNIYTATIKKKKHI
jgi:hypothetical protein